MDRKGAVIYLAYSGLVQHSGEFVCHLNRLRAMKKAGVPCLSILMEPSAALGSTELATRLAEAKQVFPTAVFLIQRRSARRIYPSVLKELKKHSISAILFTQAQAAWVAWGLKRRFHVPAIWDCRGFAHERNVEKRSIYRRAKDWLVESSEIVAARIADHTVCVSEAMKSELISRLHLRPETITVLPNGTDINLFRPDANAQKRTRSELRLEGKFVFVFAGSALPWHCLKETADFVAQTRLTLPQAHLLMLSTDLLQTRLVLAESRLAQEHTTVISVPHAEVPRFLAAADVAFLLRTASAGMDVCSPMKFAEYLACGLPVIIGPAVGDYTRWVQEERLGVVVDPEQPQLWISAIEELSDLMQDSELSSRCRRIACERLDHTQDAGLLTQAISTAQENTTH